MIRLHKKFGQVFLIDKNIVENICKYADIKDNEIILEIGAGTGNLTEKLLKYAKQVISVEYSDKLACILRDKFNTEIEAGKLILIEGDALKIDFPYFDKIVSNIPYQISSPLLFKFFKYRFKKAVLLVQKEFALRLVALPGTENYSRLSVNAYYFGITKILDHVSRSCFRPVPNVDSAIIDIVPHHIMNTADENTFFEVTKLLFSQRRKMIKNILNIKDIPYADRRVESLSPEEIIEIADYIFSKNLINFVDIARLNEKD
ncbi:MAG: 16S rRNA (adenine(1518)-N(6)/adenine(1519)-N(6))-dimethyltransferase RsmA [Thermoplasmata archaeon]